MTQEEIYKNNQKKAKRCKKIAPIVFWVCLAISFISLVFAIRNSFGNVREICDLLDNKQYNGQQIAENYNYLKDKWGEITVGDGSNGFSIVFIDIGNAMFSGVMIASCFVSVSFLVIAFVVGKWLLPKLSEQITQDNEDMVNLTVLRNYDNNSKGD